LCIVVTVKSALAIPPLGAEDAVQANVVAGGYGK